MVVTPGSGHPTPFETAATLVVATLTIVLALRLTLRDRPVRADSSVDLPATAVAR
jgi:hypothetical protein